MNFWRRLRLIGTVVVVAIATLAIAFTLLKQFRDSDSGSMATPGLKPSSSTTGL